MKTNQYKRRNIRISLPSKGRLADETLNMLENSGIAVKKPNPRQYEAEMPAMPGVKVLFQRATDIAISVRDGIVDFGITGLDVVCEKQDNEGSILIILEKLGYGECRLCAITPEANNMIHDMTDLRELTNSSQNCLRVATQFPNLSQKFFKQHNISNVDFIAAEGTLEIAPLIGYADLITDLVSSGTTLRDNRLKVLSDGLILDSQACLIANRNNLLVSKAVMNVAQQLLEFIVAHLRAKNNIAIYANIRGESPEADAKLILGQEVIRGLQGPTISRVITHKGENWFAAHLIVEKSHLPQAIRELRSIGGSGVVVSPVNYIFEEEPEAYRQMLTELGLNHESQVCPRTH